MSRVPAEAFAEPLQHVVAAVDGDGLGGGERRKGPAGGPQEVFELGRDLDPRRATADHDEPQERVQVVRVVLGRCLLEHRERPVAEVEGVAERPDPDRVLDHPGHGPEVRHASEGDHERVIGDLEGLAALAPRDMDDPGVRVDRIDVADLDLDAPDIRPEGDDDVGRLDRARDDVGQEGLEDEVVIAADEGDRDRPVVRWRDVA